MCVCIIKFCQHYEIFAYYICNSAIFMMSVNTDVWTTDLLFSVGVYSSTIVMKVFVVKRFPYSFRHYKAGLTIVNFVASYVVAVIQCFTIE